MQIFNLSVLGGLVFLCMLISAPVTAQNQALMNNANYKNVIKYCEQAEQFLEQNRIKDAQKRLGYAEQFYGKLVDKGFESEIKSLTQRISSLKGKLKNSNTSSTTAAIQSKTAPIKRSAGAMSRSEFRTAVNDLNQKEIATINRFFSFLPHLSVIKDYHRIQVKTFNKEQLIQKINQLKKEPEAQAAYNRASLNQLKKAESFLMNMENQLQNSAFEKNFIDAIAYLKSGARTPEEENRIFQTMNEFLNLLQKLLPNSQLIKEKQQNLNSFKQELSAKAEKERVAAAKAKEQKAAAAAIESRKIPAAGMRDAKLEAQFKKLARNVIPSKFTITQVIITSNRWGVDKDALGRPMNRNMMATILHKDSSEKCYQQNLFFTQKANGASWGPTTIDRGWSGKQKPSDCH